MKADVTHYTLSEGANWLEWPFKDPEIKPSVLYLMVWEKGNPTRIWIDQSRGLAVKFHALKLSDGAEWDSINGFRKPEWNKAH